LHRYIPRCSCEKSFQKIRLLSKDENEDELIYRARELNPLYPGIFDLPCWEIGRNWCKSKNPICEECYLNNYCLKENI